MSEDERIKQAAFMIHETFAGILFARFNQHHPEQCTTCNTLVNIIKNALGGNIHESWLK